MRHLGTIDAKALLGDTHLYFDRLAFRNVRDGVGMVPVGHVRGLALRRQSAQKLLVLLSERGRVRKPPQGT